MSKSNFFRDAFGENVAFLLVSKLIGYIVNNPLENYEIAITLVLINSVRLKLRRYAWEGLLISFNPNPDGCIKVLRRAAQVAFDTLATNGKRKDSHPAPAIVEGGGMGRKGAGRGLGGKMSILI